MKEQYKTKDLAEASALLSLDNPLTQIERQGNTCWFIFEDKEKCDALSNQYFFGKLMVNARDFYESMSRLKNRIFSE